MLFRSLLLPGGLCSAAFYDDVLAEPKLRQSSIRFVATTLPGHAGTSPPEDVSIESYGRQAAALAAELGCDAVVGHSLGANVASALLLAHRRGSSPIAGIPGIRRSSCPASSSSTSFPR